MSDGGAPAGSAGDPDDEDREHEDLDDRRRAAGWRTSSRPTRAAMLIESTGLAFIAALSPTALLVTAVYLGSARPKMVAGFYLLGALVMSLVMGIVLVFVLRNLDLSHPDHRT